MAEVKTDTMQYYCGIDIGASTAKLVIINSDSQVIAKALERSGIDYAKTAEQLLNDIVTEESIDRSQIVKSFSTGYGRDNVPWTDGKMTEIACHGRGAYFHFQKRMTVIDIGAQDSKIIHLDETGKRENFKMNRKCAAGTGAFIEEIASRLALDVSELNALAEASTKDVSLGSFCTVFAATEVLAKIRAGVNVTDIVRGVFNSVVKRIVEMDRIEGMLVMTGGVVANNPFLAKLIGQAFGTDPHIVPYAQYNGAFGAALFAAEQARKSYS